MQDIGKDDIEVSDNAGEYSYYIAEVSPDNKWYVTFEDTGNVAYMYLGKMKVDGSQGNIIDHLWIYNAILPPIEECKEVFLLWSEDSNKVALIVDQECWGIFDLSTWRKVNAPRVENRIETIPKEYWDKGLREIDGEPIKSIT